MDPEVLNAPHRELSNSGLGIVVALSVRWQNNLFLAYTGCPISLYLAKRVVCMVFVVSLPNHVRFVVGSHFVI